MKTFSMIIFTFFMLAGPALAQFNTGDKFLSGTTGLSAGFSSEKDKADNYTSDATKNSNFSIYTRGGYFIKQRFALGGLISYSHSGSKYNDAKSSSNTFMAGPVVRYYRGFYQGISPFAEGLVAFGVSNSKSVSESTYNDKHNILEMAGGVGANYFFRENIALEGLLQYEFMNRKPAGDNPNHNHHTSGGLNLSFGITVYFSSI